MGFSTKDDTILTKARKIPTIKVKANVFIKHFPKYSRFIRDKKYKVVVTNRGEPILIVLPYYNGFLAWTRKKANRGR